MQCEVCGRKIIGKQYTAIIEGAKMLVCSECAHYGTRFWEAETERSSPKNLPLPSPKPKTMSKTGPLPKSTEETLELIGDYPKRVRQAREKLGLSHEDLGKKINEKVSLLKKIETGKMKPTQRLAEKLERTLKIKLFAPLTEPKLPQKALAIARQKQEITLGDLIKTKEKPEEK
ncbi:MAG: multiprotein bridging factor aMBF1 [Candidatus Bathyarchaeia archaeon]|jgi:putative transcription factor|nr:TIGR00270 family protein [Candidatus Bathyarchaeota archaeon A05DMB-4]MDH7595698.1 multiprotein bridging factor aMBF1 [Candidatus Bathyarchaeota archaeon]